MLGKNPNLKIAGASYAADLAQSFNREVQRIIQEPAYADLFPNTRLNDSNVKTSAKGSWLRNADIFEVVGAKGFYKSVGVGGPLTGTPVDIAIIDDPVKDAVEANSATYRNRVWDWYSTVLETRLHNASQVLITLTRWHEDDLAGRLLEFANAGKGEQWTVLTLPAIKEDNHNPEDPREIGEALWENRHSKTKILNAKSKSERTFASLYQQRPAPEEGGLLKRDWWQFISKQEYEKISRSQVKKLWVDGAYTAKQENDPSGFMVTCFIGGKLYIQLAESHRLEFPEFREKVIDLAHTQGIMPRGIINIEPKASGPSVIQSLQRDTNLPVKAYKFPKASGVTMNDDKYTRISAGSTYIESGRVVLVEGSWNEGMVTQCCIFPNGKHDEYVDLLAMAIADAYLQNPPASIRYTRR